jgi:hypothetical protein
MQNSFSLRALQPVSEPLKKAERKRFVLSFRESLFDFFQKVVGIVMSHPDAIKALHILAMFRESSNPEW